MPSLYEIKYMPEGRVVKFAGSRGNYYELEDGSRLDVVTTPVWCRPCGKITEGERIESLAKIDKRLADLYDPNSESYRLIRASMGLDEHSTRYKTHVLAASGSRKHPI